jgi:hypothetical protein
MTHVLSKMNLLYRSSDAVKMSSTSGCDISVGVGQNANPGLQFEPIDMVSDGDSLTQLTN